MESKKKIIVKQTGEAATSIRNALASTTEALASINNAINIMDEKNGEIIRTVEDGLKDFTPTCNATFQNDVLLERRLRALEVDILTRRLIYRRMMKPGATLVVELPEETMVADLGDDSTYLR
jgi:hypothetical protein